MKISFSKVLITIVACFFSLFSYSQSTFQQTIGAPGIDKFNTIITSGNDGFVVAGESSNIIQGKGNAVVVKLNQSGQIVWAKTYGSLADRENLNDIIITSDNAYVSVGERYLSDPKGRGEVGILLKTDTAGGLIWWKEFDHNGNEAEGFSLQETADRGFVTAGMMKELQVVSDPFFTLKSELQHLYVLKTDKEGVSQWAGYLAGSYSSKALYTRQTKDNGYIVTGHIYKTSQGDYTKICLMKLDEKGNMQWLKVYDNDGRKEETGMVVIQTDDKGYLVCGSTLDAGQGESDLFLLKTDSKGEIVWKKTYGGPKSDMAKAMKHLKEGGYVIAGSTGSFGNGSDDAFLLKVKEDGSVEWFKTYGGKLFEMALGLAATNDGFALAGFNINAGVVDGLCIKTDRTGNNGCNGSATLISGDFSLEAVKYEGLKWEITRSSTTIKQADRNSSGAEQPNFTTNPFCGDTKTKKMN